MSLFAFCILVGCACGAKSEGGCGAVTIIKSACGHTPLSVCFVTAANRYLPISGFLQAVDQLLGADPPLGGKAVITAVITVGSAVITAVTVITVITVVLLLIFITVMTISQTAVIAQLAER